MTSDISFELTVPEKRLKGFLRILVFFYLGAFFVYLLPSITFIPPFLKPYPFLNDAAFANNSSIKMALCVGLCFAGYADVRRFLIAVEVMMIVMVVATINGLLMFFFAKNNYVMQVGSLSISIKTFMLFSVIIDAAINVVLILLYRSAQRARYQLVYFSPMQFRTLTALADVVIHGETEILTPKEVAYNVDKYMRDFRAKSKWITRLTLVGIELYPLVFLKPPISYMRTADRKNFLMRHFYQSVALKLAPGFLRVLIQAMIRMGKQLCYMGYYNDPKVHPSIGYIPFSQRPDRLERIEKFPIKPHKELTVLQEQHLVGDELTADVLIIGSGPAASVLAKGLLEKGRTVLMMERGGHTPPSQFNEDEMDMASRLYADGSLQQARDFRFQVIQGNCVGGSSVVNNAVCFDTPDHILDRWNDTQGLNAGLDLNRYKQCNTKVNSMVGVHQVPELTIEAYLNPGGQKFVDGCEALGLNTPPNKLSTISANIEGCLGCGYCNIGCKYGKKLSMLDTILPETQAKYGTEALRIIAGCEAWKIKTSGGKVTSVIGKFVDSGKKLEVKANTVLVAAGAVSSSILLLRSGIAKGKAGKHLGFNIGSPMTALFAEPINAYNGLQISHYLQFKPDTGYIFETWYNPPMFQSTVMPGWWDEHFKNMLRYNHFAATGVLAASESNAEVRVAGITGRDIKYKPTKKDLDTLLDGLMIAGEIYLAAGAEAIIPNTFSYYEYRNLAELKYLKNNVKDSEAIGLGTGHPQGGNVMSATKSRGVVDPEFKVYGYDNLYVCDASVFPGSIGVNPQITVMSLAEYAVQFVASK